MHFNKTRLVFYVNKLLHIKKYLLVFLVGQIYSSVHSCPTMFLSFFPPLLKLTKSVLSCLVPQALRALKSTGVVLLPPGSHPSLKPTCVTLIDGGSSTCFCRQPRLLAAPLPCTEIRPYRTRSSLHNDPNESRSTGLDYFKQFAQLPSWQQISPSHGVMVIPWLLLTSQKQCVDLDFTFSRLLCPHGLGGERCHSGG